MPRDDAADRPTPPGRARRIVVLGGAWLAFVAYAIFRAPPDDPALTRALVHGSLTGDFGAIDPSIAAVFSALGVVPLLAVALLARGASRQRIPLWPFAVAMFALGAFALLPYLALRDDVPRPPPPAGRLRRALASRPLGWLIVAGLGLLAAWALTSGSATAYAHAFRTTAMVHVMSIDACVCTLLVHALVEESRRAGDVQVESPAARAVRFVPLFGAALWNALVRRSP
jgi:hypothetical protein